MAFTVGYTNASWTLKADLVAGYVCRILGYMDSHSYATCTPEGPGPAAPTEPIIDLQAGYVLRALDELPRQGTSAPWRLYQNYFRDLSLLRRGRIDDRMFFARAGAAASTATWPPRRGRTVSRRIWTGCARQRRPPPTGSSRRAHVRRFGERGLGRCSGCA